MSAAITLEPSSVFPVLFPEEVKKNSNSLINNTDKVVEEMQESILTADFFNLRNNIGEELFNQLSYEQRKFIVDVSGTIDLGQAVDIDAVYKGIEKFEYE